MRGILIHQMLPMHAPIAPKPAKKNRKAFWLKQLHMWHWMSSAVSLVGLLLFAVTGFTLNHAAEIEGAPVVAEKTAQMPTPVLATLSAGPSEGAAMLPPAAAQWVEATFPVKARAEAEWSAAEVYLPAPRPGGDCWVAIDRATGMATGEVTDRGWISYLNDLHKGRNTGSEWVLFMDIFSVACVIFCLTGLALLAVHARRRPSTWPIVLAGLLLPIVVLLVFVHS